jgi:tetratricopeptide (TPR) repeat protein
VRRSLLCAVASAWLLGAVSAQAASIGDVRVLLGRGERARARETLDAMLSTESGLTGKARDEAAILRADLEEDGAAYESRLRELLDGGGGPAREARLRLALGHVLFARGEIQLALGQFQKGREKGLVEEGSLWEGICALALGDPPSAREALDRAASSGNSATRQRALLALGDSYRLAGDPEEAIVWYRRVTDDSADGPGWSASALLHQAECLRALKHDEEAEEVLRALLDIAPASYDAPAARALARALAPAPRDMGPAAETPLPSPESPSDASPDTTTATPPIGDETAASESEGGSAGFFAVQLGAFTSEENAVALAAAARERTDRRVRIATGSDGLLRVVVGSFPDHAAAAAFGDSLGAAIGASASVVPAPGD